MPRICEPQEAQCGLNAPLHSSRSCEIYSRVNLLLTGNLLKSNQKAKQIKQCLFARRESFYVPLRVFSMWCLSSDQPPRLVGSSSKPCRMAVLFSHSMRLAHDSYSYPTDTTGWKNCGEQERKLAQKNPLKKQTHNKKIK